MAMVGTVVMSAPRANDLHGFLAKANLERFCYRLEHELKLDSVSRLRELNDFSDLVQLGMTKKDIGSLRKQLKRVEHPSGGTFSLLRNKAKPVKTTPTDVQVPPSTGKTTQPAATHNIGNRFEPENVGRCSSCGEKSNGGSAKGNNVCIKCQSIPKTEHSSNSAKRGSLKRSMSAATDHVPSCHPINRVHSTAHPSCLNGQRLALRHDERVNSQVSKRFSLRAEVPRTMTPTGKNPSDKRVPQSAPPLTDVLSVLAGPPPFLRSSEAPNPPSLTDRSPLIEMDKPPFGNSFDNIAASESGSISRSSSGTGLVPESAGRGEPVQPFQKMPAAVVARHSDGKRRKWFPQLRVKIPEDDNALLSSKLNIKKLSASEERKIDEALELAGTFARLGTTEHLTSTPRTPGASSKESKESLSSSAESPTTPHFRFALFKSRREEKKTFAEELASHLTHPGDVLTPEALDAYERLVSKVGLDEGEDTPKIRPQKQSTRLAHRLSLRVKFSRHVHPNRSSLSESDKSAVVANQSETSPPGRGRSVRFGSTGRTLKNLTSVGDEHNLFGWFDRNPLNSTTTTKQGASPARPKSLQSNFTFDNRFPLSMPPPPPPSYSQQRTPPIRIGKESGVLPTRAESVRRSPPPLPSSTTVEFCPPPAVPPRIPLRQSTVNTKPRQRHYPLPSGTSTADKQRSYSEGTGGAAASFPDGQRMKHLPRGTSDMRSSTDDDHNHSSSPEPHSPTTSRQLDHTHGGSDDSVFDQRSPVGVGGVGAGCLGQQRSMSAKNVKVNVEQLGFCDKNDPFWVKSVTLDLCHSESDLLREALTPIPGRYETSDCISYEDLMEFALENRSSDVCDEIRVMRKMFSNEVPVSDCMDALVETSWDIHSAVKLIRLKQLLNAGLGTQEQCKEALMASNWNVDEAASFLLASSSE